MNTLTELSSDADSARDEDTIGTSSSCTVEDLRSTEVPLTSRSKRRRRKQETYATILRKYEEVLERCRILEARLPTQPLDPPTTTTPTTFTEGASTREQVQPSSKSEPVVVWIRVESRRRRKRMNAKHQPSERPSPSVGTTATVNLATTSTPTETTAPKRKRSKKKTVVAESTPSTPTETNVLKRKRGRKKTPSAHVTPKVTPSLEPKVKTRPRAKKDKKGRANQVRKKTESTSSKAPILRRHRQRKQRDPTLVPSTTPQSSKEGSWAEQQSNEGAESPSHNGLVVSAPGRS